ncbi:BgTH12-03958 [Blumeria graminis f. sp. triticale]|uniref:BgTH12-03958 n=2 Tax=Blumeria graminis TaxID=34373 RepID=A0A9W4GBU5_BLUGR|nr:BgTH12-03958 [Blumeria graminis f. sp. triticale]
MEDDEGRSPGSTMAYSEVDEQMTIQASSPIRADSSRFVQHFAYNSDSQQQMASEGIKTPGDIVAIAQMLTKSSTARKRKEPPGVVANNSTHAGNKVKHLKKDDGEPLWRKDIQYDFLKAVFDDPNEVFTNSYEPDSPKQTFANLYIDTMARSSKTSKILRDKLLTEHEPAKNMAMVCLLVNLGRMNTTLNFFPEMRAQLRTYHAIPSLQAYQDPNSYKQLQDAPRLKSILKGASEDRPEPSSLDKIKHKNVPRTNPVNLIFVLAQYAPRVTELHMPPERDFYDLIMAENLSSESRAKAFLWLLWFYLESDFTEEGADENPFGPGVDYEVNVRNQGVPRFKVLTPKEQDLENLDTPEEKEYGYAKMKERKRIIEADQAAFQAENGPPKRGPKPKLHLPPDEGGTLSAIAGRIRPKFELTGESPSILLGRIRPKYESDLDSTRSTPPPRVVSVMRVQGTKARGSLKHAFVEGSSPVPQGELAQRRSRPLTAHQLAVERNRNQRVDYILIRGLRRTHHQAKKERKQQGAFWRALQRINKMVDPLEDSEDETTLQRDPLHFKEKGFGGIVQLETEEDDFGEEFSSYAAAFRRMGRRLNRWEGRKSSNDGSIGIRKTTKPTLEDKNTSDRNNDDTEDEQPACKKLKKGMKKNGNIDEDEHEDLDDMEKEILGLQSDCEDGDEDLDDVDKALLGLGGEETEEEEEEEDISDDV